LLVHVPLSGAADLDATLKAARATLPAWRAASTIAARQGASSIRPRSPECATHATFVIAADADAVQAWLRLAHPELTLMSAGETIDIYKEAVAPANFIRRFALAGIAGSHAPGHTRMATESRVTTAHSHPFSTGLDLCLVHNGSLSNHNRLRRTLQREGIRFQTDNDSEVAAGYLTWRMREGATPEQALEMCMEDLDGFYTFAVGTADGFAVLRDPIACKPAVMGETDEWVAMASEYRAIAVLPGARDAVVWEPEPGHVYSWGTARSRDGGSRGRAGCSVVIRPGDRQRP
jgi:methylamine---glutamate N-methyltransferase subunit A